MFTKREWIIFAAGAQTFHALSHIIIMFNGVLPITFFGLTITRTFNFWAIMFNVVVTILFFWWLQKENH